MTPTVLEFPERKAVADASLTMPQQARELKVTDAPSYQRAAEFLKAIKALRQKAADTFDKHIAAAFRAHRDLVEEKRKVEAPLTEAEGVVKRALSDFDAAERRRREEAQRQADAEARKKAEDERVARAAAMEREARATDDPALEFEAIRMIEEPAPVVAAPTVAVETPKVAGITHRDNWKFRITNAALIPREYLVPDEKRIGGVVRSLKDATNIPGVVVYNEPTVAASAR